MIKKMSQPSLFVRVNLIIVLFGCAISPHRALPPTADAFTFVPRPLTPSSTFALPNIYSNRHHVHAKSKLNGENIEEDDGEIDEDDEDEELSPPILPFLLDDEDSNALLSSNGAAKLSRLQVESLTVAELKQQLRLRGKKVSGKKSELVNRLLGLENAASTGASMSIGIPKDDDDVRVANKKNDARSKASAATTSGPATPVDVSEYLDEEDKGKAFKSTAANGKSSPSTSTSDSKKDTDADDTDSDPDSPYTPEVWGEKAKIVDDFEGRSIVVDSLSRTVIDYTGYNRTTTRAYVTASRSALRSFLAGGGGEGNATMGESPEERVRRIQRKREEESRVTPKDFADIDAPDTGDEAGHYANILERDYGDWGVYSPTGAQISAQEVQGVLLLSDVRGAFHYDTEALADKIAFECQPVVVMAPDLFRGLPWEEDLENDNPGFNSRGETYEEWRANHLDERVNVDIRAASAVLRKQYGVSSIAVFGTCYGGGRALEAAAGWSPPLEKNDAEEGKTDIPPPVDPAACIAWYPTRYNAAELFGTNRVTNGGSGPDSLAVMAVFAENDEIPGARPQDAEQLKSLLEQDDRIKDRMVKVFPDQEHGFAHVGMGRRLDEQGGVDGEGETGNFIDEEFGGGGMQPSLSMDSGDAEVACLLSTAWMETYTRTFLPTTGKSVMDDEDSQSWSELEMPDLAEANKRDIRKELEEAVKSHKGEPLDLQRMPSYQYGNEIFESEGMEDLPKPDEPPKPYWDERLDEVSEDLKRLDLSDDDDDETYLAKIKDAYDEGKLQSWMGAIDAENPPEVPRSDLGYGAEFGEKFIDAWDEINKIGLEKGDDMNQVIKKLKGALDGGQLQGIQELRKERAAIREKAKENVEAKLMAAKKHLKDIGVEEGDDMDTTYRKLKQAIDDGRFDKLASDIAVGRGKGGALWDDEEEGPW